VPKATYPPGHEAGMRVPKGGSMCKNCEYLANAARRLCGNSYFIKWNGSNVIPGQIDAYCSDFYEPAKGPSTRISQLARA
jgi:hypothetical protein